MLQRKELIKRLDRLTSIVVRYTNATTKRGKLGNVCVSTNRWFPIEKIDAGHFIQRGCLPLRFDLRNVNPESVGANRFSADHLAGYANTIVSVYGAETLQELVETKRKWQSGKLKVSTSELRRLYNERLEQARPLVEKYNLKIPKSWYNKNIPAVKP